MKGRRWWAALRRTWRDRPARIRMGRQGLRFRVYLLVSVGVLAPAALVAGASWTRLRELDEELLAARRHAVVAVAEHIDEELTADLEVLQRLASAPQLGLDRERLESARTLLRAAYLHSQFKAGMFLLDAEGKVLAEEPRASRSAAPPAELPELRQTLADGKPRLTDLVGVAGEGHAYALVSVMDWRGRPVGWWADRGRGGAAAGALRTSCGERLPILRSRWWHGARQHGSAAAAPAGGVPAPPVRTGGEARAAGGALR